MKTVRAVERAIDILRCFDRDSPSFSVTELQKRLGLTRPTLYRLLQTLEKKGMVRSFGDPQRFELDWSIVEFANRRLGRIDVAEIGRSHMIDLWKATDETVALFVPTSPHNKICVQEWPSRQALVFTRGAGFSESTTVGSSGRVILAFMPPDDVAQVLGKIQDSAERDALRAELAGVRRDGFCISSGEIIAGAIAIAAPVFDATGGIVASVCLFGPEARLTDGHMEICVRNVCDTADVVSAALGSRPDLAAE